MCRLKSSFFDCMAALLLLVLFRPFGIGGDKNPFVAIAGVVVLVFISSILSSILSIPFFKREDTPYFHNELKRMNVEYIINIPILAILIITYIGWYVNDNVLSGWIIDGKFLLWPYLSSIVCVTIVSTPIYIWNRDQMKKRFLKMEIEDLQTLNAMLESEQEILRSRLTKDNVTDKIIIHGDSRESLIVNPLDIMYVESLGNYLSIVYFNDSDLCQKRLRSSLKEVEDILESFPFMVHIHRAFLVNINFITQVSGNSAGYKICMFSLDRVFPGHL